MSGVYAATPYSRHKIRELTSIIRAAFGLTDVKHFPIVHLLEIGLPQVFEEFTLEIVDNRELPNQYAVAYPAKNLIMVREGVYEGAISGVARDRFTIAHEIGHFMLHQPVNISLARSEKAIPPYMNPEWQANTFAGELLAPPHIIRGLSNAEVTLLCGVSKKVAEIQLQNL
ncbi:ImmA/IrrE family metallo-endopeptidase [Brevibacillus nitrificans]|uniref:ImmA/IrrE family metallo-endopeptidase n=1 Tax=Brevibacillus nitrificans TaxID=651560 RepID=A0A3M8DQA0_9BACL|nr:ImmA/IrrE family metallo-endopeptidase [Brevibacillus nitrificans]RNB90144.1 ImmA/IrrE family metallo-endopeptidase [Brevibacillus nitrificans]